MENTEKGVAKPAPFWCTCYFAFTYSLVPNCVLKKRWLQVLRACSNKTFVYLFRPSGYLHILLLVFGSWYGVYVVGRLKSCFSKTCWHRTSIRSWYESLEDLFSENRTIPIIRERQILVYGSRWSPSLLFIIVVIFQFDSTIFRGSISELPLGASRWGSRGDDSLRRQMFEEPWGWGAGPGVVCIWTTGSLAKCPILTLTYFEKMMYEWADVLSGCLFLLTPKKLIVNEIMMRLPGKVIICRLREPIYAANLFENGK